MASPKPGNESAPQRHKHATYASEATGLLVVAGILLILSLLRYWHHINWSLR